MFDVQFGPNGVQWCSDALLTAIAEASQRTGRRIHMHLLETRYQRAWADATHPEGVVKHLDALACCRHGSHLPIASGPGQKRWSCWRNGASPSP